MSRQSGTGSGIVRLRPPFPVRQRADALQVFDLRPGFQRPRVLVDADSVEGGIEEVDLRPLLDTLADRAAIAVPQRPAVAHDQDALFPVAGRDVRYGPGDALEAAANALAAGQGLVHQVVAVDPRGVGKVTS